MLGEEPTDEQSTPVWPARRRLLFRPRKHSRKHPKHPSTQAPKHPPASSPAQLALDGSQQSQQQSVIAVATAPSRRATHAPISSAGDVPLPLLEIFVLVGPLDSVALITSTAHLAPTSTPRRPRALCICTPPNTASYPICRRPQPLCCQHRYQRLQTAPSSRDQRSPWRIRSTAVDIAHTCL
jgi:hypothetical protein